MTTTQPTGEIPTPFNEFDRLDKAIIDLGGGDSGFVVLRQNVPFVEGALCAGFNRNNTPGFDTSHTAEVTYQKDDDAITVLINDVRDARGHLVALAPPRFRQRSHYPEGERYDGFTARVTGQGDYSLAGLRGGADVPLPPMPDDLERARSLTQAFTIAIELMVKARRSGRLISEGGVLLKV